MIEALPQRRNMVIVQNSARSQQFQGIVWFGEVRRPLLTIVKTNLGEKPIAVDGCDLLDHAGGFAAYGDKKLLRYTMDTAIDTQNRLFFFGLFPGWAEANLARWLMRKIGETVTCETLTEIGRQLSEDAELLKGWCEAEQDAFQESNRGYLIFAEPPDPVVKEIRKAATLNNGDERD